MKKKVIGALLLALTPLLATAGDVYIVENTFGDGLLLKNIVTHYKTVAVLKDIKKVG